MTTMSGAAPLQVHKEEELVDTSTASDDSGQGPWTVVTSPTHARTPSDEVSSPPHTRSAASPQKLSKQPAVQESLHEEQQQVGMTASACMSLFDCPMFA